ncbi:hypothetical protein RNI52_27735 [Labrys neptuniae]|uniref:hypothetical protein n=1 Tax=Labrys TaxID=204476 RepID=UPI00288CE481|nr:hypothetical protein [Labrys neptuniae]MDT3381149.1 hypothetical protein [Labrys neptuniae]
MGTGSRKCHSHWCICDLRTTLVAWAVQPVSSRGEVANHGLRHEDAKMAYSREMLERAHRQTTNHRQELEKSASCGCFYCCQTFTVAKIEEWIDDEEGTALCPYCGIDSLIGSASGYPVNDREFLQAMHKLWFE